MHLLLVSGIGLTGSYEDPDFDVLRDPVPHGGLQVWLLQAGVWEYETLVCGIQIPMNCGLWTKKEVLQVEVHLNILLETFNSFFRFSLVPCDLGNLFG